MPGQPGRRPRATARSCCRPCPTAPGTRSASRARRTRCRCRCCRPRSGGRRRRRPRGSRSGKVRSVIPPANATYGAGRNARIADTSHHDRAGSRESDDRHSRRACSSTSPAQVRLEPRRRAPRSTTAAPSTRWTGPAGRRARPPRRQLRQQDVHGVVEGGRRPGRRPGPRVRGRRAPADGGPAVVPRPGSTSARPSGCSSNSDPGPPGVLPAGARRVRQGLRDRRPGDHPGRGAVRGHHAAGVLLQREQRTASRCRA